MTSTANVVSSIGRKLFANELRNCVVSEMFRERRLMILPVSSRSK